MPQAYYLIEPNDLAWFLAPMAPWLAWAWACIGLGITLSYVLPEDRR
jgi:hypothetical protein